MHSSDNFHLKYINSLKVISQSELVCLTKSFGFPKDLLVQVCKNDNILDENGSVSITNLEELSRSDRFIDEFNMTYNIHSHLWNYRAFITSIIYNSLQLLSFDELNHLRIAYEFYEVKDGKGLQIVFNILQNCLKMAGLLISPLKLKNRIKNMRLRLTISQRLQFDEFLEIVFWCELQSSFEILLDANFQLIHENDKNEILLPILIESMNNDFRVFNFLNRVFVEEEWTFLKEMIIKSKRLKLDPLTQLKKEFNYRKNLDRNKFQQIMHILYASQTKQNLAECDEEMDFLAELIVSIKYDKYKVKKKAYFDNKRPLKRPKTTSELIRSHYREFDLQSKLNSAFSTQTEYKFLNQLNKSKTNIHSKTLPAFSKEHNNLNTIFLKDSSINDKINELKFNQLTLDTRLKIDCQKDLEYLRPGILNRSRLHQFKFI